MEGLMSDIDITSLRGVVPVPTLNARFWKQVNKTDKCWIWIGRRGAGGYGQFTLTVQSPRGQAHRNEASHRILYEALHGPIPRGVRIRHSCDMPPCVRPDHLSPGTDRDNWHDRLVRGRLRLSQPALLPPRTWFGRKTTGVKISDVQAMAIRTRYSDNSDVTVVALAREHGVATGTIRLILLGKMHVRAGGPITTIRKIRSPNAKLTPLKVTELRRRYAAGGETVYTLAKAFGISPGIVSQALRRETWAMVNDGVPAFVRLHRPRLAPRKLSPSDVEAIRARVAEGIAKRQLAEEYRVSKSLIYDVLKAPHPTPPPAPPRAC